MTSQLEEGLAFRERLRLKAAAACFERAVAAEPARAESWFWLAVTRDNRGQEKAAIPAYQRALGLGLTEVNRRAQAWTWLANALSESGQHAAALAALTEAENLGGYSPAEEYRQFRATIHRRSARARS